MAKSFLRISLAVVFALSSVQYLDAQDTEYEKVTNKRYGYSFEKPVSWISSEQESGDNKFMLLTSPGTKKEEVSSLTFIAQRSESKTLDDYAEKLIDRYVKLYKEFALTEKNVMEINGLKYVSLLMEYHFDDLDYKMNTILRFDKGMVYQINTIVPEEIYERDKEVIGKIVSTFSLLK